MEYRSLGRTGVQVSALCLGCMMFGQQSSEQEAFFMIDRALDEGINFLDTANVYNRGRSEETVGQALTRNGKRHRVIIATKVHGTMDHTDPNARGNSRRHIIEQCEASLKRLQTDYIDLYQIHRPSAEIPMDETLRALDDLVRSGKIRYLGTSTYAAWQVVEALWISKELGLHRVISEQPPYNLLDRRIERELLPMAQTYGLAILPWSPLAEGFLTGKYRPKTAPPADSRLAKDLTWFTTQFTDSAFQVLQRVETLAREKACTPSQVALAWCMQQPGITSPIIGPRTLAQLEDNLGALSIQITDDDRKQLDEVAPPGRVIVPYYEANFGPHIYHWT
ncbi:MAG: aldo/keto reductase [Nitrospirae bacterium]|nr:MAG: aldo/keto reductase [Nitrospirota bacterium]